MRLRLVLVVVVLATTLTGRFVYSHPSYPEKWAPVENSADICDVLPGDYTNSGEEGDPARGHVPSLAAILFEQRKPATNVRIQKMGESAEGEAAFLLTAESSGTLVASRTIAGKCGSPFFSVPPVAPKNFLMQEGVLAYENTSLDVGVATDGALVVHATDSGIGLMMGLPAGGSEYRWLRYPRVTDVRKGQASP